MEDDGYLYRTKITDPTEYETALCKVLFAILGQSIHDLPGIVEGLNQSAVEPRDGGPWTEEIFTSEMARLGSGPEAGPPEPVRY